MEDPHGRPTVKDYMKNLSIRLYPVGRLDWDSEGLLILTNDGEYAQKIMHPKAEVTKTYLVKLNGTPKVEQIGKLRRGVTIVGGRVSAKHISKIKRGEGDRKRGEGDRAWYKIVITEGKNRQIRQMFAKIGFDVMKLQRIAIGKLRLGQLKRGQIAFLTDETAQRVFEADQAGTERTAPKTEVKRTSAPRQKSSKRVKKTLPLKNFDQVIARDRR